MEFLDEAKVPKSGQPVVDLDSIRSAYRRYVGFYDVLFGFSLEPGRRAAAAAINQRPGQRILEVGVGTGLALRAYRRDARVTGIDLSGDMLDKARARVAELRLSQIEELAEMDGQAMSLPDHSFDAVVAMYVLSVVPSPAKLLAEMRRVCAPGGEIAIVNHFASKQVLINAVERSMAGFAGFLGFRPNLELAALDALADLPVIETRRINLFGYSTLIRYRNGPKVALRVAAAAGGR